MDEIRKTAKTVEEAIAAALAELGVSREEADITVIDEGSKAFLGMFGGKDAVVLVKKNFQLMSIIILDWTYVESPATTGIITPGNESPAFATSGMVRNVSILFFAVRRGTSALPSLHAE